MSKLKELNYIFVKYVDNQRRIYLNLEKIPTKVSSEVAENGYQGVEESFYHKRNNKKENYTSPESVLHIIRKQKAIIDEKIKELNKTKDNITKDEFKKVFNMKLLNVIMNLENQELLLKKS